MFENAEVVIMDSGSLHMDLAEDDQIVPDLLTPSSTSSNLAGQQYFSSQPGGTPVHPVFHPTGELGFPSQVLYIHTIFDYTAVKPPLRSIML